MIIKYDNGNYIGLKILFNNHILLKCEKTVKNLNDRYKNL